MSASGIFGGCWLRGSHRDVSRGSVAAGPWRWVGGVAPCPPARGDRWGLSEYAPQDEMCVYDIRCYTNNKMSCYPIKYHQGYVVVFYKASVIFQGRCVGLFHPLAAPAKAPHSAYVTPGMFYPTSVCFVWCRRAFLSSNIVEPTGAKYPWNDFLISVMMLESRIWSRHKKPVARLSLKIEV